MKKSFMQNFLIVIILSIFVSTLYSSNNDIINEIRDCTDLINENLKIISDCEAIRNDIHARIEFHNFKLNEKNKDYEYSISNSLPNIDEYEQDINEIKNIIDDEKICLQKNEELLIEASEKTNELQNQIINLYNSLRN